MNLNNLPTWQKGLILLILITTITILVVYQVNTVDTATKTEATLFNIIQFIFSIIFAWLLSAFMGESQYIESQRKFAIGAFRRIKEIERSINRTEKYLGYLEHTKDEIIKSKIIAVKGGLASMQDTVRSSIADWSDIIGDEIQISKEIDKLKKLRNDSMDIQNNQSTTIEDVDAKINKLMESLPQELLRELEIENDNIVEECIEELADLWIENEGIILDCFWEKESTMIESIDALKVNDRLQLARGMTENRTGALMLYNDNHQQVAVVTNVCTNEAEYDDFVESLEKFYNRKFIPSMLNGNPLSVKILHIEDFNHESERQYLSVIIEKSPNHPCVYEVNRE